MTRTSSGHVIIIGAGAAGLAAAVCLRRAGVASTVLEKGPRPLAALHKTDPEMRLLSPERVSRLPYMGPPPSDRPIGAYPTFEAFVNRLEHYREGESIAVVTNAEVTNVRREGAGFEVSIGGSDPRTLSGTHVINATGIISHPVVPEAHDASVCGIPWLHSLDVRTSHLHQSRRLLVVGGGSSAAEVLDRWLEVRKPEDEAWLALRGTLQAVVSPILGIDLHYLVWLPEQFPLRGWGHRLERLPEPMNGRRVVPAVWRGLIRRVGCPTDYARDHVQISTGEKLTPDLLVFATGFRYRTEHLGDLIERTPDGMPIVHRCESTRTPGLYLLGLRFGRTFASPYFRGIARDARFVVKRIARSARREVGAT